MIVKHRKNYFSFLDEKYLNDLEVIRGAGNNLLHSGEILDEYTKEDFDTLRTMITAICDTIETKEENDKKINALKQKNNNNQK